MVVNIYVEETSEHQSKVDIKMLLRCARQRPRGLKITTSTDERMVKEQLTGLGRGLESSPSSSPNGERKWNKSGLGA